MLQLRGIAGDAVIPRHQRKPAQPRVQQLRWRRRSHFALAHCGGLADLYRYLQPARNENLSCRYEDVAWVNGLSMIKETRITAVVGRDDPPRLNRPIGVGWFPPGLGRQ